LHTDAQPAGFRRYALLLQQLADFYRRFFRYVNHILFPPPRRKPIHKSPAARGEARFLSCVLRRAQQTWHPARPASSSSRPTRP
jgi:hypothetical protein